jgi:two-component system response regulator LytT
MERNLIMFEYLIKRYSMQSDISVLIIEDEETWTHQIMYDLKQFGYKIVAAADNVDDALPAILANNFDIALLDINLNGKNSGIKLGKIITQTAKKPFIFITGTVHNDIMHEAAAALPSAFLTKPVNPASLFISIQSALHHFYAGQTPATVKNQPAEENFFFVKLGNKYTRIDWQDVVCLRSEKNYTSIITDDRSGYMIRSSLQKALQYIIPESLKNNFVQVNRAEVLHTRYIEEVSGDEVITPYQSFSITDAYMKNLKQQLNIIL